MRKELLLAAFAAATSLTSMSQNVDFDLIRHWAGDPNGEKQAALVVQFNDGKSEVAYVWGYRWNGSASGEDMIRAIANSSHSLSVLVQYTGNMGSTLDGVGLSTGRCIQNEGMLAFDYDGALNDYRISFNYEQPNTMMGQESAPGFEANEMNNNAIQYAYDHNNGIIEHPLNARRYGYPAYDYDYWQLVDPDDDSVHWKAGWYEGYWSYWVGQQGEELVYSGLGMSSAQLADRSVNMWNYVNDMSNIGTADEPFEDLDYEMADFGEYMSDPEPIVYPVDFDYVRNWAGNTEGEKFASFVFKFNDGKGPETFATGYKWTGGWDDNISTALKTVFEQDPRFTVEMDGSEIKSIQYDSNGDGHIDDSDHNSTDGTWQVYADFTNETDVYEVPLRRFVNPRSVIIVTRTPDGEEPDYDISSYAFRPSLDETAISLPRNFSEDISDSMIEIPFFSQNVDMDGELTCTSKEGINFTARHSGSNILSLDTAGIKAGTYHITVSSPSKTRALTESNECLLTLTGIPTGIDAISGTRAKVTCSSNGDIRMNGCNGYNFKVIDVTGRVIGSFVCDSDDCLYKTKAAAGLYLVRGSKGNDVVTEKFILQ